MTPTIITVVMSAISMTISLHQTPVSNFRQLIHQAESDWKVQQTSERLCNGVDIRICCWTENYREESRFVAMLYRFPATNWGFFISYVELSIISDCNCDSTSDKQSHVIALRRVINLRIVFHRNKSEDRLEARWNIQLPLDQLHMIEQCTHVERFQLSLLIELRSEIMTDGKCSEISADSLCG